MRTTLAVIAVLASAQVANAAPTQSSFTPTGYKYPIMSIQIMKSDGTNAQSLYTCTGATSADCLVDLADTTALSALAATGVDILEGSYDKVILSTCPAGSSGSSTTLVQVQGTVAVGSTTYNTDNSHTGGMSTSGTAGFADITTLGCGGAVVNLLQPVVITAGSTQTLTLLVDLSDVVWTDANASGGMGGCRSDNSTEQDLCTSVPKVIPFIGGGTPTFERYKISHLSGAGTPAIEDANAVVSLAIDPSSEVFYVILQPFYTLTSPTGGDAMKAGPDYNTTVRMFSKNMDGSIAFQSGGDASDNRVGFTAFQRMTHTGTCKNELSSSPTWNYQAFKQ